MGFARKHKRRKQRATDKKAVNEMAKQLEYMQNMPGNCSDCDFPFERNK